MSLFALGSRKPVLHESAYVAPGAVVIGQVEMCEQSSVWFGSTVRGDSELIRIGARSNVQDGSVLHTDPGIQLLIGEGVSIGHKVMLHGCTVGDNTLIGIGAVVLNHAVIGKNCLIGANALITEGKEIPDGSLVMGTNKVVRALSEGEIEALKLNAASYVRNSKRYREGLSPL